MVRRPSDVPHWVACIIDGNTNAYMSLYPSTAFRLFVAGSWCVYNLRQYIESPAAHWFTGSAPYRKFGISYPYSIHDLPLGNIWSVRRCSLGVYHPEINRFTENISRLSQRVHSILPYVHDRP